MIFVIADGHRARAQGMADARGSSVPREAEHAGDARAGYALVGEGGSVACVAGSEQRNSPRLWLRIAVR